MEIKSYYMKRKDGKEERNEHQILNVGAGLKG